MSNKAECPGCRAYASFVWDAMNGDRKACECGLSGSVIYEVYEARKRKADRDLTERYEEAIVRAGRAEAELERLREHMATIQREVRGWEQEQR